MNAAEDAGQTGLPITHRDSDAPARDPFVRRTATAVAIVAAAALAGAVLVLGADILLAAFGGILFAVLLRAGARVICEHTPVPAVMLVLSRFYREDVRGEARVVAKRHGQ